MLNKLLVAHYHYTSIKVTGCGSPTQNASESKVTQLDDSSFGEQDVLRLHVSVNTLQQSVRSGFTASHRLTLRLNLR